MYQSDLKHPSQTLEEKLHRLYTLNRDKKIDLSFRPPYLKLLEAFGNPQDQLPPVIHVAGTNGKGSIIAMLRACLEAAGYKVHAYTSPHLIRFNERIVLAGQEIKDGPLEDLIDEALELNADGDLTFFEITTAMAFAAFMRTPADICLLEVGMGGRLDCTNVITDPLLTIISSIGMDHQEHLGETIAEIAGEKAGIMKQSVPCVIGHQPHAEAMNVFADKAAGLNVTLHHPDQTIETSLPGTHQAHNAAAALKALERIEDRLPLTPQQIKVGLQNIEWPARLQGIQPNIYLDGGHNEDAGRALAQQAAIWKKDGQPLSVILGMMKGKDAKGFLEQLLPFIDHLYVVNIENEPLSQNAQDLLKAFPQATACQNYREALEHTKQNPGRILICGSLYLAGHVLQDIQK